jgi:5-methylcytosine-specific restriction endonuclease McrA
LGNKRKEREMKRETSVHNLTDGKTYAYPEWYYQSIDDAKKKGICRYCGDVIQNKRSVYCSDRCREHWQNWAGINSLTTNSVRREIHKRFGFACTNCGTMFYHELKSGVKVPRFYGERHHIIPLENGGEDSFDNQTLLCHECHKIIHSKRREK